MRERIYLRELFKFYPLLRTCLVNIVGHLKAQHPSPATQNGLIIPKCRSVVQQHISLHLQLDYDSESTLSYGLHGRTNDRSHHFCDNARYT